MRVMNGEEGGGVMSTQQVYSQQLCIVLTPSLPLCWGREDGDREYRYHY